MTTTGPREVGGGAPLKSFWAIVLAGGDGTRLSSCPGPGGGDSLVPKQFRVIDGSKSMLERTIERACAVVSRDRVVTVVAPQHRRWWQPQLAALPARNVVVQPRNRGTAAGILLPLMTILRRDPRAGVLIFPSDHVVDDEELLREAMITACTATLLNPREIALIGVEPSGDTEDYGWIVPLRGSEPRMAAKVSAFAEKPDPSTARRLREQGALVNTLITAADGLALLRLFGEVAQRLVERFRIHYRPRPGSLFDVDDLYADLPTLDFSSDVLQKATDRLVVCAAESACGWIDIGTPERLRELIGHQVADRSEGPRALSA